MSWINLKVVRQSLDRDKVTADTVSSHIIRQMDLSYASNGGLSPRYNQEREYWELLGSKAEPGSKLAAQVGLYSGWLIWLRVPRLRSQARSSRHRVKEALQYFIITNVPSFLGSLIISIPR